MPKMVIKLKLIRIFRSNLSSKRPALWWGRLVWLWLLTIFILKLLQRNVLIRVNPKLGHRRNLPPSPCLLFSVPVIIRRFTI